MQNAGYRVIASLHLEKGYSTWESELTPEYTPYDAGLGFCVALNKDDFLGRAALAKIKAQGPQWTLCTFTIDAGKPVMLRGSEPILLNNKVVGVTTAGGYGYTVGKNIAYGYVSVADARQDKGFAIEVAKEVYPAKKEPNRALYDPERKRILG